MSTQAKGSGTFSSFRSSHQATPPQAQSDFINWFRQPIRRKDYRRISKKRSVSFPSHISSVYLISLIVIFYYTYRFRSNIIIVLCDALILSHTLKLTFYGTLCATKSLRDLAASVRNHLMHALNGNIPTMATPPQMTYNPQFYSSQGSTSSQSHLHTFQEVLARARNTLMHAMNGNAVHQTTPPTIINLEQLLELPLPLDSNNAGLPVFKLSRNFLLECRPPRTENPTPQYEGLSLPILAKRPSFRKGLRGSKYFPDQHVKHWFHKKQFKTFKDTRPIRHPKNSIQTAGPTPPPGGTPGVASATNKSVCPNPSPLFPPLQVGAPESGEKGGGNTANGAGS